MTTVRKLLLAVLLVSLAGSAFGAGTFATFNASTTNASSTFATGTLVLTNKAGATTCLSTGAATNTDLNNGTGGTCGLIFNTSVSKPGDMATIDLDLTGSGTLDGSKLQAYGASACVDTTNTPATYTSTGNACQQVQLAIQEYTNSTNRTAGTTTGGKCWYGGASTPQVTGATITAPVPGTTATVTGSNNTLNVTIDGTAVVATIPSTTYNSPSLLAAAVQTAIRSAPGSLATTTGQALVGATWTSTANVGSTITIASGEPDNVGSVSVTGGNAATTLLGFTPTASNAGSAISAACTMPTSSDASHSLAGFATGSVGYTSTNSLQLGATGLTAGQTRYFRITVKLPDFATNDVQGRKATMSFGWRLDQ